jgi:HEAT repeat protein
MVEPSRARQWLERMPNVDDTPSAQGGPTFESWLMEGRAMAGLADELVSIMSADQDPIWRSRAVLALGHVGSHANVENLIRALSDEVPLVAMEAAASLGQLAAPEAIAPLLVASHNQDANVRANAVLALGSFDDSVAVQAIARAGDDPDALVRSAAREATGLVPKDPRE